MEGVVFQGSAKHEVPVAGWYLIGLATGVQKEAERVFSALQGSKEYFATLQGSINQKGRVRYFPDKSQGFYQII